MYRQIYVQLGYLQWNSSLIPIKCLYHSLKTFIIIFLTSQMTFICSTKTENTPASQPEAFSFLDHEAKIKVYRPTDPRHSVVARLNENAIYYRLPEFLLAHQISVRKFRLGHCLYQLRITFLIFSFFWEKRLIVKPKLTFLFFIIACHRCNSHPRALYPP